MNSEVWRRASTNVVFPAPDGAERTNRIPLRVNRLLKVLDLLANLFQLRLAGNDPLRYGGVIGLGAECVELSKDFLSDELQRATDRLMSPEVMGKLCQMTFDPRQFFGNIGAVREERNLLNQALVLRSDRQTGFLNPVQQGGAIFFDDVGMKSADLLDLFAHRFEPADQILGEMFTLSFTHFDKLVERRFQRALDRRPGCGGIERLLGRSHYAGRLQNR